MRRTGSTGKKRTGSAAGNYYQHTLPVASLFLMLSFLLPAIARAQLCSGSLGDPIVKIDFGSGNNPGPALGQDITTYTFVTNCPNDGMYTIASSTESCFGGSWHPMAEDHTPGDVKGYMMVVNANYTAGDFYVKRVDGLCGGTTFEFASWLLNVQRLDACGGNPIKPNVTFRIETTDGKELLKYNTGDISSTNTPPQWKQYGAFFTTPPDVSSVVIRMTNNAPGGCGNDIVLDDITFRPCGPKLSAAIAGDGADKEVCKGDTATFTFGSAISSGYSNPSYQWQVSTNRGSTWADVPGATTTAYTRQPTEAGTYLYRLAVAAGNNITSANCRVVSNNITITVHDKPDPAASSNNPACVGENLALSAASGGSYAWTGPNGFTSTAQNPTINAVTTAANGMYYVTLTTPPGCRNTDSVAVTVNTVPDADAGPDTGLCEGSSVTLQGTGTGTAFAWTPATGLSSNSLPNPVARPSEATTYILSVSNGQCKGYDTVLVEVWQRPAANAGDDKRIFQGANVQLDGEAGGTDVRYFWTPAYYLSNPNGLQPAVSPDTDTTYTLNVVSERGCGTATDRVFVRVYKKVTVPNAFSPNGDGINDTWKIDKLPTYPDAELVVFNRYGQAVFRSKGSGKEWDGTANGKPLPVGTYYYTIDLKTGFGNTSGWVMIVR